MNFVQVIVMADGSYGPVEGAMIIAIPEENNNAEDIEETIDAIRMFDYPPKDCSEGFVVTRFTNY